MGAPDLTGGFAAPSHDAARAFRAVMEAMARPGTLHNVEGAAPPAPLSVAAGVVALTLCDGDTGVHLAGAVDTPEARRWITFHTGAPIVDAASCDFAFGAWEDLQPLAQFKQGEPAYPDRSATLVVARGSLDTEGVRLTGPGIKSEAYLNLPDPDKFAANAGQSPLGLDFIFTCGTQIAALPRSTKVTKREAS